MMSIPSASRRVATPRTTWPTRWRVRVCGTAPDPCCRLANSGPAGRAPMLVIAAQQHGLAVGAIVNALLKAVWADDLDVSDAAVVATIMDGHGMDAASLLDTAASERVRAAYAENTDRAVANGVFGLPFYLFNGQVFWGQDRLEMLEEAVVQRLRRDGLALGRSPQRETVP